MWFACCVLGESLFHTEHHHTFLFFSKDLTEDEYNAWLQNHKLAEVALDGRDEKLAKSAESIETELTLLGATGMFISHLRGFRITVD